MKDLKLKIWLAKDNKRKYRKYFNFEVFILKDWSTYKISNK